MKRKTFFSISVISFKLESSDILLKTGKLVRGWKWPGSHVLHSVVSLGCFVTFGCCLNPPFFICTPIKQRSHHWVSAEAAADWRSHLAGSISIQLLIEREMGCFIPQLDPKVLPGNAPKMGQSLEPFMSVEIVTQIPVLVQRESGAKLQVWH